MINAQLSEMLTPIATEAIYSATYVDNYLDSVENLPDDVQRQLSRIRDIDVQYRTYLRDVDHYYDLLRSLQLGGETSSHKRSRVFARMQQSLIQAQELSDEKMHTVTQLQELIDQKTRQLDNDQKNLDIREDLQQPQHRSDHYQQITTYGAPTPQKQSRTQSPIRGEQILGGSVNGCSGIFSGNISSGGGGGGGSTPNSERSGNASNGASAGGSINGNSGGNINSNIVETQRLSGKRSRRRTDTNNTNSVSMELGGNESNSANEAGSGGGGNERITAHKSSNLGGQKKNSLHLGGVGLNSITGGVGGVTGGGVGAGGNTAGKKKKRKARGAQSTVQASAREETPPPDPIDPDEPTYCVCNQISFGEMILCDNDLCPIEWFHFSCVSLVLKPKGKWYCPNCRGDRPNVMKPKAQFLKELERYNKEKEEKT